MSVLRVLVYAAAPESDPDAVSAAYHRISEALRGTPGLLGNELLRSTLDDGAYLVMSAWESREAFERWERGPGHRDSTAPLRPFQDSSRGRPFGIYEVVATY